MSLVVSTVYSEFMIQAIYVYPKERFEAVMSPFIRFMS